MKETSLRTWILWAAALFILSLSVDYFFLHFLFDEKAHSQAQELPVPAESVNLQGPAEPVDVVQVQAPANADAPEGDGNFLSNLKKCAPEIAAQAIATPEALVEYLQKSVGAKKEDITLENYHLTLPDGSLRRVQVLIADNSNSKEKRELRLFAVDAKGYPDPLPVKANESLDNLLKQGKTTRHEVKSEIELRDGSHVLLEKHDNRVYEIQYNNQGKILSCRYTQCQCPS